jgi:hypothetical protein
LIKHKAARRNREGLGEGVESLNDLSFVLGSTFQIKISHILMTLLVKYPK